MRVPVGAGPLINRRGACRALQGLGSVSCRARHVVVRDNGRTHRLKRPVGGVSPAEGDWGVGGGEDGVGVEISKHQLGLGPSSLAAAQQQTGLTFLISAAKHAGICSDEAPSDLFAIYAIPILLFMMDISSWLFRSSAKVTVHIQRTPRCQFNGWISYSEF